MTLMEVLVVMAMVIGISAVMIPAVSNILALEQRAAARKIALAFERLQDEAVLRNKTFRVVFDLDRHRWFVEEGHPNAKIFATPEAREAFQEEFEDKVDKMSPEEQRTWMANRKFSALPKADQLGGYQDLPEGIWFDMVYTPQFEEPVRPARERGRLEETEIDPDEPPNLAAVYLFSNGFVEFAIIRLVEGDLVDEGYSITVDPLSGRVALVPELVDHRRFMSFLPSEGPRLP